MSNVIHGIVHGNIIQLREPPGVPDGQEVEVFVRAVESGAGKSDAFLRSAGALADDPDWDRIMAEIQQERKLERRPPSEVL